MIRRTGPWDGILHEVVEHNGVLYFGGLVSEDLSLDIAGQTADALRQADALLAAHGSDKSRILSAQIFISDLSLKPGMNEVWKRYFEPANLPARAAVGADLGPGVLVEIVFTAAVR
jgi:enamine deaminase RidA (YjgF/YER057c/UK114 family)